MPPHTHDTPRAASRSGQADAPSESPPCPADPAEEIDRQAGERARRSEIKEWVAEWSRQPLADVAAVQAAGDGIRRWERDDWESGGKGVALGALADHLRVIGRVI